MGQATSERLSQSPSSFHSAQTLAAPLGEPSAVSYVQCLFSTSAAQLGMQQLCVRPAHYPPLPPTLPPNPPIGPTPWRIAQGASLPIQAVTPDRVMDVGAASLSGVLSVGGPLQVWAPHPAVPASAAGSAIVHVQHVLQHFLVDNLCRGRQLCVLRSAPAELGTTSSTLSTALPG